MAAGRDQRLFLSIFLVGLTYHICFSVKQNFKYFLALDFEAQCQQGKRIQPQEIIEFPCIMVDSQNFQIIDTFHQYVKVIYDLFIQSYH